MSAGLANEVTDCRSHAVIRPCGQTSRLPTCAVGACLDTDEIRHIFAPSAERHRIRKGARKPTRARRITAESPQVVRTRLGLSQPAFADLLGISVATLRNWEQGRRHPTGAAEILLRIAAKHPTIVREAVLA